MPSSHLRAGSQPVPGVNTSTVLIAAFVAATVVALALAMSMPYVLLEFPLNWFVMGGGSVLTFGFVVASGHAVQARTQTRRDGAPSTPDGAAR